MKKLFSMILALAVLLSLSACGGGQTPAPTAPAAQQQTETQPESPEGEADRPVMGVCIWAIEAEYFTNLAHWLEVAGEDHGWDVIVQSGDASDPSTQVDIIENFITLGVDAIFVNPINFAALETVLQEAKDAGIFIFGHNYRMEDSQIPDIYLSGNPFDTGARAANMAKEAADEVIPEDTAIVCAAMSSMDNENNVNRSTGMTDRAKELWGEDCIVSEAFPANIAEAMSAAENIYTVHPEVNVWLCYNDECAMGVYQFYNANNLDQAHVVVVGVDGNVDALEAIAAGSCFRGTLSQGLHVKTQAFFDAADILVSGGTVEEAQEAAGYDLYIEVNAENAAEELEASRWQQ